MTHSTNTAAANQAVATAVGHPCETHLAAIVPHQLINQVRAVTNPRINERLQSPPPLAAWSANPTSDASLHPEPQSASSIVSLLPTSKPNIDFDMIFLSLHSIMFVNLWLWCFFFFFCCWGWLWIKFEHVNHWESLCFLFLQLLSVWDSEKWVVCELNSAFRLETYAQSFDFWVGNLCYV